MKLIKSLFYKISFLLVILTSLFVFFLTTTPGLFLAVKLANLALPGKLRIVAPKGLSIDHFAFDQLTYDDTNVSLTLRHGTLQWQLSSLLHKKFTLKTLQADTINFVMVETQNTVALTHVTFEGTLKDKELNAKGHWQQMGYFYTQLPLFSGENGQMAIKGTWPTLEITLTTVLKNPLAAEFTVNAHFNPTKTPKLGGTFKAQTPVKQLTVVGQFHGEALNRLSLISQMNTKYLGNVLNATLNYQRRQLNALIMLGSNRLQVTGNPSSRWFIDLNFPEPSIFHPALKGLDTSITAKGSMLNIQKGSMTVTLHPGKFRTASMVTLPFEGGKINASLNEKELKVLGNLLIDGNTQLQLDLHLPDFILTKFNSITQKIKGNLHLIIHSLAFMKHLNPAFSKAEGQLKVSLKVSDQLAHPEIMGDLQLTQAALSLPSMGINLNPVQFSLQTDNKKWQGKGRLFSNGKVVTIQGKGNISPQVNGLFHIDGEEVPFMNTNEFSIHISPKLRFEFTPTSSKISGHILVPKAQIKPQTFDNTLSLSKDARFVSDTPSSPNPFNLNTDVSVEMGKEVSITIKGLKGFLAGEVKLLQLPKKTLTAHGELNIRDGNYKAYGQDLLIDKGQLRFTGAIDKPEINVRATRQFNHTAHSGSQLFDFQTTHLEDKNLGSKTTVGVEVMGPFNSPKIQLFSVPSSLSQADILSMLLLGKPASQASKSGGQLLFSAISAYNLSTGNRGIQLIEQLKQAIALDFNLENSSLYNQKTNEHTDKTALVVGKSLSKRLYLSYNMGLSQTDSNVLTLKYLLNQFFSIQVNASMTGSGVDLLYTHQKE